jgi:hypothetical protein
VPVSIGRLGLRRHPGRRHTKQNAGDKRQREREPDDDQGRTGVDGHVFRAREGHHEQHLRTGIRDDEADQTAESGEQNTLRKQLTNEPGAHCAEGGAYRHFRAAAHAAYQKEVGDISARNEQHEARDPRQQHQVGGVFLLKILDSRASRRERNVRPGQHLLATFTGKWIGWRDRLAKGRTQFLL